MTKKNTSQVYTVQDVLDIKLSNGITYYKVKWKGYSLAQATWEPQESFNCSRRLLDEFLRARADRDEQFEKKLERIEKERKQWERRRKGASRKSKIEEGISQSQEDEQIEEENSGKNQKNVKIENGNDFRREQWQKQKRGASQTQSKQNQPNKTIQKKSNHIAITSKTLTNHQQKVKIQQTQPTKKPQNITPSSNKSQIPQPDPQTKPPAIQIATIRRQNGVLRYLIKQNGKKVWKDVKEMHQKYSRELCQYYEAHLSFDE